VTTEEFQQLRKELLNGNTQQIEQFYTSYKQDCQNVLVSRNLCDIETSSNIFTDAVLILHKNLVSGKIKELSSARSYLISTCLNLARKEIQYITNTQKKLGEVRLLFYDNNDTTIEDLERNEDLLALSKKAFSLLTERCQKIIMAFYINNLSMKEIATELELSSSDVAKTLKSRCYKYLLTEVEKLRKGL